MGAWIKGLIYKAPNSYCLFTSGRILLNFLAYPPFFFSHWRKLRFCRYCGSTEIKRVYAGKKAAIHSFFKGCAHSWSISVTSGRSFLLHSIEGRFETSWHLRWRVASLPSISLRYQHKFYQSLTVYESCSKSCSQSCCACCFTSTVQCPQRWFGTVIQCFQQSVYLSQTAIDSGKHRRSFATVFK